jgi:hypothetical protein
MKSRRRRRPLLSIFTLALSIFPILALSIFSLALSFNINVHPSAIQIHPFTIHTHVSANSRIDIHFFRLTCPKMAAKSPKNINIKMSAMTTLYFLLGSTCPPSSSSLFASAFPLGVGRRQ